MKAWANLLLCLLLSFGIWLIYNLSQDYSSLVSVDVVACSAIEGRAETSSAETGILANCRGTGFRLLRLARNRNRQVRVWFDPSDLQFHKGDLYGITPSSLVKYAGAIFGDGITLEAVVSDNIEFRFAPENYRKVPVRVVQTGFCKPQYMPRRPMSTVPDSVLIYGEPYRIESIEAVMTRPVNLGEIRSSVRGVAKLEKPADVRLSHQEVSYEMEVTRFVEIVTEARVTVRNAPTERKLSVFPQTVSARFCCEFPVIADPSDVVEFYVDYREFSSSIAGSCIVHCDNIPDGVIEWTANPQVCECVENQ